MSGVRRRGPPAGRNTTRSLRGGIGLRFQHHRAVLAFGVTDLVAAQLPENVI